MEKVNLSEKLALFSDLWSPKIVGELNGQHVKLVKLRGEFIWHHHENEDELFLVLGGALAIHFRDSVVRLTEGEFVIVPKGVEHKPVAEEEAHVLLLEPASTLNTGNVRAVQPVRSKRTYGSDHFGSGETVRKRYGLSSGGDWESDDAGCGWRRGFRR